MEFTKCDDGARVDRFELPCTAALAVPLAAFLSTSYPVRVVSSVAVVRDGDGLGVVRMDIIGGEATANDLTIAADGFATGWDVALGLKAAGKL